jgi:hypothetical protein
MSSDLLQLVDLCMFKGRAQPSPSRGDGLDAGSLYLGVTSLMLRDQRPINVRNWTEGASETARAAHARSSQKADWSKRGGTIARMIRDRMRA